MNQLSSHLLYVKMYVYFISLAIKSKFATVLALKFALPVFFDYVFDCFMEQANISTVLAKHIWIAIYGRKN